jgi:hypothetical protein
MLDANLPRISTAFTQVLLAAALALAVTRLHAQDAAVIDGPPGYQVACSIQSASGNGTCGGVPAEASCNAEGGFGSQPSTESTGIAFVNRGDLPVKVYWLNFQGTRVLYNPYLAPGDQQQQQTYVGHNWLVTTLADQCIGIFQASSADNGAAGSDGTEGTNESVSVPPPELPTYDQSPPPDDNLVWTPGYWAWGSDIGDYYWVPAAWAAPPAIGYLWTPGYWVARGRWFVWNAGYWGPHVGFYGGINYGFGYYGRGYVGGAWQGGRMIYNRAATNVGNLQATRVYNQPVAVPLATKRVSFNGAGGITVQPSAAELAVAGEHHLPPTTAQLGRLHAAQSSGSIRGSSFNPRPAEAGSQREEASYGSALQAQHGGNVSYTNSPQAQHGGTISYMSSPPAHPAAPAARSGAAAPVSMQPHMQSQPVPPRATVQAAPVAARAVPVPAEQPAAQPSQPRPTPQPARPRIVPHAESHPP